MMELFNVDPKLRRQYESAFGAFVSGDFAIGQHIKAPGVAGEIIWSFRKNGTGPVTYVIDSGEGWPIEIKASEVHG